MVFVMSLMTTTSTLTTTVTFRAKLLFLIVSIITIMMMQVSLKNVVIIGSRSRSTTSSRLLHYILPGQQQQQQQKHMQKQRSASILFANAFTFTTISNSLRDIGSSRGLQNVNNKLLKASILFSTTNPSSSSSSSVESVTSIADTTKTGDKGIRRVKTVHAPQEYEKMIQSGQQGENEIIKIQGWVRTVRQQKTVAFIQVNDGSNLNGIQCAATFSTILEQQQQNNDNESTTTNQQSIIDIIQQLTTGTAVEIWGTIQKSTGKGQDVEINVVNVLIIGKCSGDEYPLAKKRHTLEYLRTIAHLRARTNTHSAISRIRSTLAYKIHEYYQTKCGFVYVHTPLITTSDCEGAGELFRVTTFNIDNPTTIPLLKNNTTTTTSTNSIPTTDYSTDFFNKPAFLTVSGQLNAETYATALGDVYTFGPTFRAENSQTSRHLAEFHMIEPEMSFCNLKEAMDNAEGMLKYVISETVQQCTTDIEFFNQFYDTNLVNKLQQLCTVPFVRITYTQAIQYLQEEIAKDTSKWQYPTVEFGTDLATEHERWLCENKFNNSCVFVYNYPKSIKAFYMRDNDNENNDSAETNNKVDESMMTVAAMDLLVPGVGELIGGSQREERYEKLIEKMIQAKLNPNDYWWYLDLRKYGTVPHSGYGLGFERLVTYCCGIDNIRDAIAYPRYPGNAEF